MTVTNAQRAVPVDRTRIARLARCAIRSLRIRAPGTLAITFLDGRRMRALNRRFTGHDRVTDVLSFRYDGQPPGPPRRQVIGEVFIAPGVARAYAARHGIPYAEELARYVVHGLLHWLGREDRTRPQQRAMRLREDRLLARCGARA